MPRLEAFHGARVHIEPRNPKQTHWRPLGTWNDGIAESWKNPNLIGSPHSNLPWDATDPVSTPGSRPSSAPRAVDGGKIPHPPRVCGAPARQSARTRRNSLVLQRYTCQLGWVSSACEWITFGMGAREEALFTANEKDALDERAKRRAVGTRACRGCGLLDRRFA